MRSPDRYRFDHAVATTYSLDFETALAIPIAIVFRDAENRNEIAFLLLTAVQVMSSEVHRILNAESRLSEPFSKAPHAVTPPRNTTV